MKNINKWWYSIIVSVMIIWFLMVVTAWVFNLVLLELNDTRWSSNYLKAYSAAEWAWELALLKIKEKWYAYYDSIKDDINNRSIVLSDNPLDKNSFKKSKESYISYDFNYRVNEYDWDLAVAGYDIIPLFYLEDNVWWFAKEYKVDDISLELIDWDNSKLAWNIIWEKRGIAWIWAFNKNSPWEWRDTSWVYFKEKIWEFLSNSKTNYLVLFNIDPDNNISYKLESVDPDKYFTKPRTDIITSAQIWKYRQNLKISLDNTEFLNILRYSIYSN